MATAVVQQANPVDFGSSNRDGLQTRLASASAALKPRDVHTTLNFHKDAEDGSAPHPSYVDKPETYERLTDAKSVTIQDVTGRESEFTLDRNGFQFHKHAATETDFLDDDQIKASYYPETEQLLKDVTGASRIFIFDHTIRRQTGDRRDQGPNLRGPVQRVHIDQSYSASLSRVSYHLPEEAETLLKGRVQIINVWRPIKQVLRDPLTIAEAHTVNDADLVPIPLIYPTRKGETYAVRHNPGQQWFYKYGLKPEEVLLIKCFDSKTDGRARRVPHSAFVDPDAEGQPDRESIEVRALVFHEHDTE